MRSPDSMPFRKKLALTATNAMLALSIACSIPTHAGPLENTPVPVSSGDGRTFPPKEETDCAKKTILDRLNIPVPAQNGLMTMRIYDADPTGNARILMAVEPGVMPSKEAGLEQSLTDIDVTVKLEPKQAPYNYPEIAINYWFPSEDRNMSTQGGNQIVRTVRDFRALLVGFSLTACNTLDLKVTNRQPNLKLNNKKIVTSGTPA